MSHIGSNIRKIRGVKNLNQSAFAELFDLKRASVGAYEEGRAEPKINTIIDIAKHFGISIDDLLTKELSVNDLFKFDIFRDDLIKDSKNNLTPSHPIIDVVPIPYIPSNQEKNYLANKENKNYLDEFESLQLPIAKGKEYRAFELKDASMSGNGRGLQKGDIIICSKAKPKSIDQIDLGKIYGFETKEEFKLRRVESKSKTKIILRPENNSFYLEELDWSEIVETWQLKTSITNNFSNDPPLENRIEELESIIKKNKLG